MLISELTHQAGLSHHSIRYSTQMGLLQTQPNPTNAYTPDTPNSVTQLRLIRQAKKLGLSLPQLAKGLALLDRQQQFDVEAKAQLMAKLPAIDQAYVAFITPRQYYLWSVIENLSEDLFAFYDPAKDYTSNRYFRQKLLKIKRIHLTTTSQRAQPNHYAGSAGYVLSFDAATGVLTAAISNGPGNRGISNINQEDIQAFSQENVK